MTFDRYTLLRLAKFLLVAYVPLSFTILPPPSATHLVIGFTGAVISLCFIESALTGSALWRLWNVLMLFVAVASASYFLLNIERLTFPLSAPPPLDYLMGVGILASVLEASRQRLGGVLPGLAILLAIYVLAGPLMPDVLYHPGLSAQRLVFQLSGSLQGPFGQIPSIVVTIVAIFLVFGGVIQGAGVAEFFISLGSWISRKLVSGAGLSCVLMSSLFGAISGAPVANAGTTGPLTIPLMKRSGYRAEEAAAIEGVSSVGSQIIPPVLGTSAFIMAQLINRPYSDIVVVSIFPSLLFIMAIALMVHAMGVNSGARIVAANQSQPPRWLKAYLLIPVGVLIVTLMGGYSPQYAAFIATLATIVLFAGEYLLSGRIKEGGKGLLDTFQPFVEAIVRAADSLIMVVIAGAVIGIIVDLISIPLTVQRLSTFAIEIADGNLLVILGIVALASLVLGTGLPTVAAYVLVAMLFVPTMVQLGVSPLAAHMFVFYFGVVSNITPPVALAVLVGTGIAGGSFWKACMVAMKLGFPLFLLPFLFVFQPDVLELSMSLQSILVIVSITLGIIAFTALLTGYLLGPLNWSSRLGYGAIAVLSWWPGHSLPRMWLAIGLFVALLAVGRLVHMAGIRIQERS